MKRDPRLSGLSSDHHQALVLARSLEALVASGRADETAARDLAARFARDLEPHFIIEDELLLFPLRAAGELATADRIAADHTFLRDQASLAATGRTDVLAPFAARLTEHVRFEERELFARCEEKLDPSVLDEVARRAPHAK